MATPTSHTIKKKYKEYKKLDLPAIDREIQNFWQEHNTFEKSISEREGKEPYVFYEGPPSANGMPGIHHVMSRTIKDLFCRYKTMKGFKVERKGGWDTHGLPVELGVEKMLGITKEDIGKKISIAEYNATCRKEVMKYKDAWEELTRKMGYWVDLENPYVTFENEYIESLWYLLKQFYDKNLLYKGYTIQPFSPGAGTGLSSHELNLPGCYKNVKDTTVTAQFKVKKDPESEFLFNVAEGWGDLFFLAWTTTPWTLPSNTALAVGADINYFLIKTFNPYTEEPVTVIIAEELLHKYFNPENATDDIVETPLMASLPEKLPYQAIKKFKGKDLESLRYEQLLPYKQPDDGDAFKVIVGDFVTTEDGTGIVHIAPSFGADDLQVAKRHGIGSLTLVDRQGKFVDEVTDFAGRYVKNYTDDPDYVSVDVDIAVKLKKENRAFKIEKYEHSYPHCWRTDKPILYYPMDSWFVKTTAKKERMAELNKTINWQPSFTGTGRFGNWLENLQDWNLSRSRYWGTPLPIWVSEDGKERKCIGSIKELQEEIHKSVEAGFMEKSPYEGGKELDLHRPYVDEIILVSPTRQKMFREPDLIDVWFDSGAMPYAQQHFPFENKEQIEQHKAFPADFIAEGVDQTRGWFFTLHAIAVMLFDSVAYKNVVSNGLVLDKNGNKMSKRLGNAADPFETLEKYGADATRWYMMANSQPWDNLKFDLQGIEEVQRKFLGTLYNTYSFFALYANIDGFTYEEDEVPLENRSEIDRWIISLLNSLIIEVDQHYSDYDPTKAARAIQFFVDEHLSNWYVRLCRRRFWKGEYSEDKIAAYQTLYGCLTVTAKLMAPLAPFFSEFLFKNLNEAGAKENAASVHLADFPLADGLAIDKGLEERMQLAQNISSMVLSLRKQENIKVRQPLSKILVPVLDTRTKDQIEKVRDLILSEVNVKEIEYVEDTAGIVKKKIKPNFKILGKKLGPKMKAAAHAINQFTQADIAAIEKEGRYSLKINGETIDLQLEEVEIISEDIEGWLVASEGGLTVALDVTITDDLKDEGNARELVNRIQRLRKEKGLEITDRIKLKIEEQEEIKSAIINYKAYICRETLAEEFETAARLNEFSEIDVNDKTVKVYLTKTE